MSVGQRRSGTGSTKTINCLRFLSPCTKNGTRFHENMEGEEGKRVFPLNTIVVDSDVKNLKGCDFNHTDISSIPEELLCFQCRTPVWQPTTDPFAVGYNKTDGPAPLVCLACKNSGNSFNFSYLTILSDREKAKLDALTIKCFDPGCSFICKRSDIDELVSHLNSECLHACTSGCGEQLSRLNTSHHLCPLKIVNCDASGIGCIWKGKRKDKAGHQAICLRSSIKPLFDSVCEIKKSIDNLEKRMKNIEQHLPVETESYVKAKYIILLKVQCGDMVHNNTLKISVGKICDMKKGGNIFHVPTNGPGEKFTLLEEDKPGWASSSSRRKSKDGRYWNFTNFEVPIEVYRGQADVRGKICYEEASFTLFQRRCFYVKNDIPEEKSE